MCPSETKMEGNHHDCAEVEPPAISPSQSLLTETADMPCRASILNHRLVEQVRSVTLMNDQWQKYDAEREQYVRDLCINMERLRLQVEDLQREVARVKELKDEAARLERQVQDKQATINEFAQLMDELEEKNETNSRLQNRIAELEDGRRTMKKQLKKTVSFSEKMELLKQQLEVCIEDFRKERREKVSFQTEVTDLKQKLTEAEQLVYCYQQRVADIRAIRFPSISNHHIAGAEQPIRSTKSKQTVQSRYNVQENKPFIFSEYQGWGEDFPDLPADIEADRIPTSSTSTRARPIAELSPTYTGYKDNGSTTPLGLGPGEELAQLVCH